MSEAANVVLRRSCGAISHYLWESERECIGATQACDCLFSVLCIVASVAHKPPKCSDNQEQLHLWVAAGLLGFAALLQSGALVMHKSRREELRSMARGVQQGRKTWIACPLIDCPLRVHGTRQRSTNCTMDVILWDTFCARIAGSHLPEGTHEGRCSVWVRDDGPGGEARVG